jgi:catechol 2,3-dioxygenase-like lactoylglutathione lyase family enzyme
LTEVQFVLAVRDLKRSVTFYCDQLGFRLDSEIEGWAAVSRDQFHLMLGQCPEAMPAGQTGAHSYFAYVTVDAVDELYADIVKKGLPRIEELADTPWGMREFGIRTPDGHRIMFGQEILSLERGAE